MNKIEKPHLIEPPLPAFRRGTVPVMAVACGIMVGNVYICQPLLAQIAHDLVVAERTSSLVAVATQIGYALGILLVVPLADTAEPARLMRWLLALTALGLASAVVAPSVPWLLLVRLFRTPYGGAANPYAAVDVPRITA